MPTVDVTCLTSIESVTFEAVRVALHVLVYLLALSTSPGLVEFVDDAAHHLIAGDTEHGDACGEECDDHGCTPASHQCGCCASIVMAAPTDRIRVSRAERTAQGWTLEPPGVGPNGVRALLERPPSA